MPRILHFLCSTMLFMMIDVHRLIEKRLEGREEEEVSTQTDTDIISPRNSIVACDISSTSTTAFQAHWAHSRNTSERP